MMRCGGRWGTCLVVLLCATLAYAKPGIVRTNDGQTFEGDVDENNTEEVTVTVRNIPVRIPRTRVTAIEYTKSFEQQFADKTAKLDPKDMNGRLALAREAINAKQYTLARDALESVLQIDNNNAEAVQMLETVRSLMRLERKAQAAENAATPRPAPVAEAHAPGEAPGAASRPAGETKLLTPAQINAIKQAEMRPEDREVRIRFERNVLKRFTEFNSKYQPAAFFALNPMQQAQVIMREGPPEMRHDIVIVNDPPALLQFRRSVQPFAVQNCATSACHGGAAPRFNLVVPADSEAASYTNFYHMVRYSKPLKQPSSAVFGGGESKLIDRPRPEQSLLLQYALPAQIAEQDHPEVTNYRPALRGLNDGKYVQLLNWVSASLQPVDPDYGFDLDGATTQPATQPATTQAATAPAPEPHPAPATRVAPPPPTVRPTPKPVTPVRPVPPARLPR